MTWLYLLWFAIAAWCVFRAREFWQEGDRLRAVALVIGAVGLVLLIHHLRG